MTLKGDRAEVGPGDGERERRAGQVAEVVITPYRDGPLLVRGAVRIQDQDGGRIAVDREVVALCRCGKSRIRPLCDGSHKLVQFRAPSELEDGLRGRARTNGADSVGSANGQPPASSHGGTSAR